MSTEVLEESAPLLAHPFVKQVVTQLRAMDSYGTYDTWTDCRVLDPLILTKERRREIPVIGDPDDTTISRVKAFYNAISCRVEAESGLMAVPMINLSHEGFGRAIITVGKLIVMDKILRDVHRFGFESLEKLIAEVDKLTGKALEIINEHKAVAQL